jgi:hypothetical protein
MSDWTIFNNGKSFGHLTEEQQSELKNWRGEIELLENNGHWASMNGKSPSWFVPYVYRAVPVEPATPPAPKSRGDMPAKDMTIREAYVIAALRLAHADYDLSIGRGPRNKESRLPYETAQMSREQIVVLGAERYADALLAAMEQTK